jgi:putative ATP-binding cassette transporter
MRDLGKLLAFLARTAGGRRARLGVALVAVTGAIAGLASTALLAVISFALSRAAARTTVLAWTLAGLCVVLPLARYYSQLLLAQLSEGLIFDLRVRLSSRILEAPLRQLEKLGPARLMASLTEDVGTITQALSTVPLLCLHLTVVGSCLVYLGWLSWKLLLVVIAAVAIGTAGYQMPVAVSMRYFRLGRERRDALLDHFRGLTEGTKELKVHRARRTDFLDQVLRPTAAAMRDWNVRGSKIFAAANSGGQVLFFVVIGLVIFVLPRVIAVDERTVVAFTLAILYMLTPMDVILSVWPTLARATVAADKINALGLSLAEASSDDGREPVADGDGRPWRRLALRGVAHTFYREEKDETFTLGPLDLELRPGELVFLIGGNGSGKTTLAKILIGLYAPESGQVSLDDVPVTDDNRDSYRQLFSVVFADFFLFESLLGLAGPGLDEEARRYLTRLHLDRKVEIRDGALSTVELSQGQRKRLALLTAYLEDRPIYLFDEWAADQDPLFKRIFYRQLLPELKRRGKTVLVISHDDQYYGEADRIVKLDYGRVEYDGPRADYLTAGSPLPAGLGGPELVQAREGRP